MNEQAMETRLTGVCHACRPENILNRVVCTLSLNCVRAASAQIIIHYYYSDLRLTLIVLFIFFRIKIEKLCDLYGLALAFDWSNRNFDAFFDVFKPLYQSLGLGLTRRLSGVECVYVPSILFDKRKTADKLDDGM